MKIIKNIILISALIGFAACSTNTQCGDDLTVDMETTIYERTYNVTTKVYAYTQFAVDSLWLHALDNDSLLYNKSTSKNTITFPLKNSAQQTDYVIRFNDTTDTLSVFYQNNDQYYISLECGCIVSHTITDVTTTGHFIDSLAIINPIITNTDVENLRLYHFN